MNSYIHVSRCVQLYAEHLHIISHARLVNIGRCMAATTVRLPVLCCGGAGVLCCLATDVAATHSQINFPLPFTPPPFPLPDTNDSVRSQR